MDAADVGGDMIGGSSKRKNTMPSCGQAAKMTVEMFQSNKRKKHVVSVCTLLLPNDMMLEVLIRLPITSILRFRAVCRSWATLFSSKDFCNLHMATSKAQQPAPKLLVVSPTSRLDSSAVYSYSPSSHRDDLLFTFDSAYHNAIQVVTTSTCCGLTLLFDAAARDYYVCNAATRAITRLPPCRYPARDYTAGLGFDDQTREYKVVRLIKGYDHEKEAVMCDVYTPGADCWRPAACGVPFRLFQFAISAVDHAVLEKIPPVFANGFLHWLIRPCNLRRQRAAIILFSAAEETFGSVRSPPFWGPRENKHPWSQSEGEHLVVMDDQVCIVRNLRNRTPHGSALEIWGLLDYGSGDWLLNHRIDLFGHIQRELSDPQVVRVIGSVSNGRSGKKIVIATSEHWVYDKFQKKIYTYDPRCKVLQCIRSVTETHTSASYLIPGSRFSLFEESLVPVHKTDEDLALPSTLAMATIKKLLLQTKSAILPMFQCDQRELASSGQGAYEGSLTNLPRRPRIIVTGACMKVPNLHDLNLMIP